MTFSTILHIPLVQKQSLLKMYKHLPVPLNNRFTANHTLMPGVGNQDIFAVQGKETYKALPDSDLHRCLKLSDTHFCHRSHVLSTNQKSTCHSAIFTVESISTREQCNLHCVNWKSLPPKRLSFKCPTIGLSSTPTKPWTSWNYYSQRGMQDQNPGTSAGGRFGRKLGSGWQREHLVMGLECGWLVP